VNRIRARKITVGFNDLIDFLDGNVAEHQTTVYVEPQRIEFIAYQTGEIGAYDNIRCLARGIDGLPNIGKRNDVGIGTH